MAKKLPDAAKAKAKRQKIMAAGGAVILLGLLAIQVPRTMKMLNAEAPPPPPPADATGVPGTTDPSVLPTPGTAGGTPTPSAGTTAVSQSDVPPQPDAGQLISFGRFASKDPFSQQIEEDAPPDAGSSAPARAGKPKPGGGVVEGSEPDGGSEPTAAPSGSALLAINGVEEVVAAGAEFPKESPVFRLVSVGGGEVKIGIAGGKLASGRATVTLRRGKTLTLVNTADGTRYEIKLISTG